jgi:hypothetical protein
MIEEIARHEEATIKPLPDGLALPGENRDPSRPEAQQRR